MNSNMFEFFLTKLYYNSKKVQHYIQIKKNNQRDIINVKINLFKNILSNLQK